MVEGGLQEKRGCRDWKREEAKGQADLLANSPS